MTRSTKRGQAPFSFEQGTWPLYWQALGPLREERHLELQHSELVLHNCPADLQTGHAAVPVQSPSAQSTRPSQSSSAPPLQKLSLAGGVPQSVAQPHFDSVNEHAPSPQTAGGPQSIVQTDDSSTPSQTSLPQQ